MTVIRAAAVTRLGRGGGVETIPLITRQSAAYVTRAFAATGVTVEHLSPADQMVPTELFTERQYPPGRAGPAAAARC
jgi:hypothetical protein